MLLVVKSREIEKDKVFDFEKSAVDSVTGAS